jgi:hypothetical protein
METVNDPMTILATVAREERPRLFALYGLTRGAEPRKILGWGMQFPAADKTLFYNPFTGETHHANDPDQLRRIFGVLGEVRLDWFDVT